MKSILKVYPDWEIFEPIFLSIKMTNFRKQILLTYCEKIIQNIINTLYIVNVESNGITRTLR